MRWGVQKAHARFPTHTEANPPQIISFASANTKTGWQQIIASTPVDATSLTVHAYLVRDINSSVRRCLFDIGIGAAGSEAALIANLPLEIGSESLLPGDSFTKTLPIYIPAGARLSFRGQLHSVADQNTYLGCTLILNQDQQEHYAGIESLGADTATSLGTTMTTNDTWTQLSASVANNLRALYLSLGGGSSSALTFGNTFVSVGIGASSSEIAILDRIGILASAVTDRHHQKLIGPFTVNIPSGSRVSAKFSGPGTANASITVYGVY